VRGRSSLFLDLDGTLTDPKVGITRCVQYALERLNVEVPPADELTWCIGPPLLESFEHMLGNNAVARTALAHYRERFSDVGWCENEVYDGVPEALGRLASSGLTLYVATSKPEVYARRIIEHFGLAQWFERLFGPTLEGQRVRKHDLLAFALEQTGVSSAAALMIGDRSHDILGAHANGIGSVAVLYGYGTRDELEDAGAQRFIASPSDLETLFD
jgi:phosphoglycolate phosphatase